MKKNNHAAEGLLNQFSAHKNVAIELALSRPLNTMPYMVVNNGTAFSDDPDKISSYTVQPFASKDNSYFFELHEQEHPQYFSMVTKGANGLNYLLRNYHFEPEDEIVIHLDNQAKPADYLPVFSGNGAAKYTCQASFKALIAADRVKTKPQFNSANVYNENNRNVRNIGILLSCMESFRTQLSPYSYELLKADSIARECRVLIANFQKKIDDLWRYENMQPYLQLCNYYHHHLSLDFCEQISSTIQFASREYALFLVEKQICDYLEKYTRINYIGLFNLFLKVNDHDLRDKMLVILIFGYKAEMGNDYRYVLKQSLTLIRNKECLDRLKEAFLLN